MWPDRLHGYKSAIRMYGRATSMVWRDTRHMNSAELPDCQACVRRARDALEPDDPLGAATLRRVSTHRFAAVPTLVTRTSTPTRPSSRKTCGTRRLQRPASICTSSTTAAMRPTVGKQRAPQPGQPLSLVIHEADPSGHPGSPNNESIT